MVRPCCICGIVKTREATSKGVYFFRFPSVKSACHSVWMQTIRHHSKKTSFAPKKNSIVCSRHFEESCFNRGKRRLWLREGSLPSIFNITKSINQTEQSEESVTIEDDASSSASTSTSPPALLPLPEINSDFEETVSDPPDLDMFQFHSDYGETGLSSFADLDMIKMDHIGSVADVLGPDPYMQEDSLMTDDRPSSSIAEDVVEVDGQTIISFASAEELEEYVARQETCSRLTKTNDVRLIKGWRNKFNSQLTPSMSPSPRQSPTPPSVASSEHHNTHSAKPSDDECNVTPSNLDADKELESNSPFELRLSDGSDSEPSPPRIESTSSRKPIENAPTLSADGFISLEYAEYAASALYLNAAESSKEQSGEDKADEKARESKQTPVKSKSSISRVRKHLKSPERTRIEIRPNDDDIPLVETSVLDDDSDDIVYNEEEYEEDYHTPQKLDLPNAECGNRFCRLGCICESLQEASGKSKAMPEHCSLSECMLQCVCGYQRGKPSSRRCFTSLLKGNESFYSKIVWSSGRQRRERRVPERFSEFHLGSDSAISFVAHNARLQNDEQKGRNGTRQNSRPSSPFKNISPHSRTVVPQQRNDSTPIKSTSKVWEPFRVKVLPNEIKLLRWDSFVSLTKVYVAPDQDIFCMEHSVYNCSCIEANRRILRIASNYTSPRVELRSEEKKSPEKPPAKTVPAYNQPRKNVAKKHTHPIMRTATPKPSPEVPVRDKAETENAVVQKTSSLSKMRRLLQDERFQLQKLMTEEKTRAFDEEVELAVRQGQTVQLVAWIRFHRIYQAGRIHIRFLSRRCGPVILVMRPNEIVAADITCDIQQMKGDEEAPEIVKELLDPFISPEETSRYAFLLCDGIKWELVGCISLKASETPLPTSEETPLPASEETPLPAPEETPVSPSPPSPSSSSRQSPPLHASEMEETVQQLPQNPEPKQQRALEMKLLSKFATAALAGVDPSATERINAMELRRVQLEERLNEIKSKLNRQPPKLVEVSRSVRPKIHKRTSSFTRPSHLSNPLVIDGDLLPSANSHAKPASLQSSRRASKCDTINLTSDECILPDDLPSFDDEINRAEESSQQSSLPDSLIDQVIKEPPKTMYPAAEKLAMFSRLFKKNQKSCGMSLIGSKYDVGEEVSIFATSLSRPTPREQPPSVVITPVRSPPRKPSEVKFLKLQPIGTALPAGVAASNAVRRIRILPSTARSPRSATSTVPFVTFRNGVEPGVIQQQRIHWSNKGVRPPVAVKLPKGARPVPFSKILSLSSMSRNYAKPAQAVPLPNSSTNVNTSRGKEEIPPGITTITLTPDLPAHPTPNEQETVSDRDTSDNELVIVEDNPLTEPAEEAAPKCIFPKILTAEVSSVSSSAGNIVKSLKIILDAMVGEHQELCPSRASMLLPLHEINDQWCLVALDSVPEKGFQIPGLTVSIPGNILGRAATTAKERKARVSFPLHMQGKSVGAIFKKMFGVYGTPQLPRHIFLGPFPYDYLEKCKPLHPCIALIHLTKSSSKRSNLVREISPNKDRPNEENSADKPTAENGPEASTTSTIQIESDQEKENSTKDLADENVEQNSLIVSNVVTQRADSPKETTVNKPQESEVEGSDDVIDVENSQSESENLPAPVAPQLPPLTAERRVQKPKRMFIARTPGLPNTTIAILGENLVLVKHPLAVGQCIQFSSIDEAKDWLQSLALGKNSGILSESEYTKSNSPASESTSNLGPEEDEIDVCGATSQDDSQDQETAESAASRSPKRIRRLTEKARILAANKFKPLRPSAAGIRPPPGIRPSSTVRPSTSVRPSSSIHQKHKTFNVNSSLVRRTQFQRQLHIRKEQERRGQLGQLLRELDSLVAPDSGTRAKVVVLNNATSVIKGLELQSKTMDERYEHLKIQRAALLTKRENIFQALPEEVRQVFTCLMESLSLPTRHLTLAEPCKRSRTRPIANRYQDDEGH